MSSPVGTAIAQLAALRCLELIEQQTFMSAFGVEDMGGCDGCADGWCQSAVDAVVENRERVKAAIRAEFGIDKTDCAPLGLSKQKLEEAP